MKRSVWFVGSFRLFLRLVGLFAINSIRNQTFAYEKIEIIISVDDGLLYDEFKKLDRNIK